jgi:hypothetical protein
LIARASNAILIDAANSAPHRVTLKCYHPDFQGARQLERVDMSASPGSPREEESHCLGHELLAATLAGEHERTRKLLALGANPRAANDEGIPAFMAPALIGNREIQNVLLQEGARLIWPHLRGV